MRGFPYKHARLKLAVNKAILFLLDCGCTSWPLNPKAIIHEQGWHLKKYSTMVAAANGTESMKDVIGAFASEDAITLALDDSYHIAYNDTVSSTERIRFSLCHEIGHIILGHFEEFEVEMLTDQQRELLDREANAFAANLLCPAPLYDAVAAKNDTDCMRGVFGMSKQSWSIRKGTLNRDRLYIDADYVADVQALAERAVSSRQDSFRDERQDELPFGEDQSNTAKGKRSNGTVTLLEDCGRYTPDQYEKLLRIGESIFARIQGDDHGSHFFNDSAENARISYTVMMQDAAWKRECKRTHRFNEVLAEENPMVIDELWEPRRQPRRRRSTSG